jgi:hypothetical protein
MHKQFVLTGITALKSGKNWQRFYTYTLELTFSKGRQYSVILTSKSKFIDYVCYGRLLAGFQVWLIQVNDITMRHDGVWWVDLNQTGHAHFLSSHTPEMIIAPDDELEPKI